MEIKCGNIFVQNLVKLLEIIKKKIMPAVRRMSRSNINHKFFNNEERASSSPPTNCPVVSSIEMKHIRLPPLRRESALWFEIIVTFHFLLFTALQFLHLYRTVWWLPQSFNSSGMNFHLIDVNLPIFILALLGRRLPYLLIKSIIPRSDLSHKILQISMAFTTLIWLILTTIKLWNNGNVSFLHSLYLFGPLLLHIHTYGLRLRAMYEIEELDNPRIDGYYSAHHLCTNEPNSIRDECEFLRKEFNKRIKGVVCQTTLIAYYSAFIPWAFVQSYVSYDIWWVSQHLILSWMYIFGLLISRAFCPDFSDGLHKAACHLGKWTRLRPTHIPSNLWTGEYLFVPGAIVKHQRELYKAEGLISVASEPGNTSHLRFQLLFSGSSFSRLLLGFQMAVVLLSLLILMRTSEWYQLISISAMVITSSHTFIRLGRDFLVVWKMYQAEDIILKNH